MVIDIFTEFYSFNWSFRLILVLSIFLGVSSCQSTKTALKALDDQDWDKVESALGKLLDNEKDTLFADVYYAYSLLYADSSYQNYQIDTAYQYILLANQDFRRTPLKEQEKFSQSISLTDSSLLRQKRLLDSLAFQRATNQPTVSAYQAFLEQHLDAPQRDTVVSLRNALAFEAARQLDSYQAYRDFMDTYPDADQYTQAEERYNTLVFQAQTQTGDLASYYQFIDAFPNSPYRPQAERAIFQIITAPNRYQSYTQFIHDFPDSPLSRTALNWLYHLYVENHPADSFLIQYPDLPFLDSLSQAQNASGNFLFPLLKQNQFGFMNLEGELIMTPQFADVPPDYLCKGVQSKLVFASKDGKLQMLSKAGQLLNSFEIDSETFPEVTELGGGLFWIDTGDDGILVHSSGEIVIPEDENATDVELLEGTDTPYQFIKYQVSDRWGIKSFTGTTLLEPNYDDIQLLGKFLLLKQDDKLAITNRNRLIAQAVEQTFKPDFTFSDAALLDQDHLVAYTKRYETLLDTALQVVVPLDRHTILHSIKGSDTPIFLVRTSEETQRVQKDSLITERSFSYSLYPNFSNELPQTFSQAYYNDRWLALKSAEKYFLNEHSESDLSMMAYDSVKILSEHFTILFHGSPRSIDSTTLLIADHNPIVFRYPANKVSVSDLKFRLLRTQNTKLTEPTKESIVISQPDQPELLITQTADTVLEATLDNVSAYPDGLYVVQQKGKQGVVDELGNKLLPIQYERISNYRAGGGLSIFHRKKFGLYHHQTSTLIKPNYESAIRPYAIVIRDSLPTPLYVAKRDGGFGVINNQEQLLLPFAFQAVRYWNDTSALVRYNNRWHVYPLSNEPQRRLSFDEEEILYTGIEEFVSLTQDQPETLIKIYKETGYGILSNQKGELLTPTYDDIRYVCSQENELALFVTEKYISEAKLHILIYTDEAGEIVYREAYSPDDYDKLYCEE